MTQFRPSRFEILPTVIKNLVIINVLFFFAQNTMARGGFFNMEAILGLHHVKSPLFQPWQLVTYLFLHGGLGHLFANMFALWMFGSVLENLWGPRRFLTFYFLCGIGAGVIQLVSLWFQYHDLLMHFMAVKNNPTPEGIRYFLVNHPGAFQATDAFTNRITMSDAVNSISQYTLNEINNPTIGASGAIFGILAAFVYLYPNVDIYVYFLFPIKAKWIGLAYFGYEIFSAVQNGPDDNVAHWAHLGGGLVGFLLILTWNKKNRQTFY
jgi:membrane associated rhomboid family serine protease